MQLKSPAKINLTLDILGLDERSDKHFANTILYRHEEIFDDITLKTNHSSTNNLHIQGIRIPIRESNTVFQALKLLKVNGYDISIHKRIPPQSGLGGGSSNAATLLKYFGEQKGIPTFQLMELARKIGADVPFFLCEGNLAYCEGFGDQIVQTWNIPSLDITLIPTNIRVSSPEAYAQLNLKECGLNSVKTEALIKNLNALKKSTLKSQPADLIPFLHNDFETEFFTKHPHWKGKGRLCGSGGYLWSLQT